MSKQMDLFNSLSQKPMTKTDKIYVNLNTGHRAEHLHIFEGGRKCQSIALDYVNNLEAILGERIGLICKRSNQTKPHHYYHYINHHFIEYDTWILEQIQNSLISNRSKQNNIQGKGQALK